jgi:hypothetical protein
VAEILGNHNAIAGSLHSGGVFVAGENDTKLEIPVANVPSELTGQACIALVRHDAFAIRNVDALSESDLPTIKGVIAEVANRGSTVRFSVWIAGAYELTVVSVQTDLPVKLSVGDVVNLVCRPDAVSIVAV